MDYKNEFHSDDDFDSSNGYGDNVNNNGNSGYSSGGQTRCSNPNGLSKAELRKTNKPIMEKRRRARINHCLNELKSLILEAMKKDPARHTKLEKADILEMTVKHLQSVQRQQLNMAIQTDPTVIHKFKTGFVECADEVNRYISQLEGVDNGVCQRLTNHLNNCATSLEQIGSMTNFNNGYRGQLGVTAASASIFGNPLVTAAATQLTTPPAVIFPPLPQDLNNNNSNQGSTATPIQMGGMHLIPSRLPSGEFALIMPNTLQNATTTVSNILNGNHNLNSSSVAIPFSGAPWPAVPVVAATVNKTSSNVTATPEFTTNLQRNSAFSKPLQKTVHTNSNSTSSPYTTKTHQPQHTAITAFHQPQNSLHQNSTMTTSPPLSPISSASSHADDSIMHTSSDFNNTSRPVTPPLDVSHVAQHSFSGVFTTPPTSAESSLNISRISSASSSTHLQQQQVSSTSGSETTVGTRKRSLTSDGNDSSDSSDEPTSKKLITDDKIASVVVGDEERDSMWRPW